MTTKTVIIGHSPNTDKLAYHLEREALARSHKVVTIGRSQVDFDQPLWRGTMSIYLGVGPESKINVIVNLFDHRVGKGRLQEKVFEYAWTRFSNNPNVQVVVIGSLAHHWPGLSGIAPEYVEAKRDLHQQVAKTYKQINEYKCRLLYIELGVLESMIKTRPSWPCRWLPNHVAAETIFRLIDTNKKTMFVGISGDRSYVPSQPEV